MSVSVEPGTESVWVPFPLPTVRLLTVSVTSSVTVKVVLVPFSAMRTSSVEPGTTAGLQLAAVPHIPLPVFHIMVKAGATAGCENSDVLPFGSVAVAVMLSLE